MKFPDRIVDGPIKAKRFITHAALALALTAGCTPTRQIETPKGNPVVRSKENIERTCAELGSLPESRVSHQTVIDGVTFRTYAGDSRNFYVTASTTAKHVQQRQTLSLNYEPLPGDMVGVEMTIINEPGQLSYQGEVTFGTDIAPNPWNEPGRAIPTGNDVCVVATTKVDKGRIDLRNTKIYSLPGTPATGA